MNRPLSERIAGLGAVVATPCVIIAIAVLFFLNPIWVGFDQDRTDVAGFTGYSHAQVQQVTGSILSDLVFGPPNFDVAVNGSPVLDVRERGHMADVRTVLTGMGLVALLAAIVLLALGLMSRGAPWFWRAAQTGGKVLAVGVVVVGLAFAVFFDQAFELFHELFFPPGTYSFDPRLEKLVQLFPDQFWSETSVALAGAVLVLALVVVFAAGRIATNAHLTLPDPGTASPAMMPGGSR